MTLKIKTNRNDLIKWWIIPFAILGTVYIIMIIDVNFFNGERTPATEPLIILGAVFLSLYLLGLIFAKLYDREKYIFTNETIQIFKWNKQVTLINVDEIVRMKYIRFSGNYVWKMIRGESMLEGNACIMYVGLKNGNLLTLGCFSARDIKKINKLYGGIIEVI